LSDLLDYELPPARIAQEPAARRDDARLLIIERTTGVLHDGRISDLDRWLRGGDALVLNETRVRPARLHLRRATGGRVECLFVRPDAEGRWRVLARPARGARPGERLRTEDGALELEVLAAEPAGVRVVRIARGDLDAVLSAQGEVPLPPYIERPPDARDRERYQTVFARVDGAVAAPTAGLHFTPELLARVAAKGVREVRVLLHVGPGTFRPIATADPRAHVMDEEWFELDEEAARTLRATRAAGGRIVAVGTTSVRALEAACDFHDGRIEAASGWTRKYILPPYRFQAVDALLTNFHLPRTTLLLLVAAFAGEELTRRAYAHALAGDYRFYSYGDAMLVL
jgi:S-adenosylmethionine:tRNA ribosyltransferase-isomerase